MLFYYLFLQTNGQETNYFFTQINTNQGLSHRKVNCIIQDSRSFIWIGTNDGLNRYDGKNFIIFRNIPGNTASLSGNVITALHEDKNALLWIGTSDGGLTCYNYKLSADKQFTQFKHKDNDSSSIPVNIINAIEEDELGFLWLATSGKSVIRFDKNTQQFWTGANTVRKTALAVCAVSKENIWAGGQGGGIIQINTKNLQTTKDKKYDNLYAPLPHVSITAMYKDAHQDVWMGSWDKKLYHFKTPLQIINATNTEEAGFPGDEILSFCEDQQGQLWIGGKTKGLFIYNQADKTFQHIKHEPAQGGSLSGNTIYCMYKDRHQNIWVGTDDGVSIYKPSMQNMQQQFLPNTFEGLNIQDIYVDDEEQIWFATNAGLYIKSGSTYRYQQLKWEQQTLSISSIEPLTKTEWLLGTNYSLFRYNPYTNRISLLPGTNEDEVMNGIISSTIKDIIRDTINHHSVFISAPYGHFIAYYDVVDEKWFSRSSVSENIIAKYDIRDNLISGFYKTQSGHLFMATDKWGLIQWDKQKKFQYYINNPNNEHSISNNHVFDIAEDRLHNLWLSTYGGGLNYFNTKTGIFTHIKPTGNLGEGIALDKNNAVWMIANGQLECYNPFTKMHQLIQLPDLENKGGVRGKIFSDTHGNMYVTGSNYYISFKPENTAASAVQPNVLFTGFSIFNKLAPELLQTALISLKPGQNYFSIEYAAPDFSGASVEYAYRLKGFDDHWIEAGGRNFVSYSNLPGGNYSFEVRASNVRGKWGTNIATLQLKIIPPFWTQWWFYALVALVVSGVIYLIYRYRLNEFKKREAIRNKIAQDLHDNMGSTLSSISVYSQVAAIYQEKDKTVDLKKMLEKIGSTSSEMIGEMSDIVWAIQPKNDSLQTIIQRMESFAKPLLQAKNIRFDFDYKVADSNAPLSMEKRKNFYLVFKEAVNNAAKYSSCTELLVKLTQTHHQLSIVIIDNGSGFNADAVMHNNSLTGNGLRNMRERAHAVQASFEIVSAIGTGTKVEFTMTIP